MRTWKQAIHRKQPWISMTCLAMVLLLLSSAAPWGVQASPAEQLSAATNSWANRSPANPPPVRYAHALAYDTSAGKVILFGGFNGSNLFNDTWAYDYATNSWANRNPANPPPARAVHALAYDASAGKVILFGGADSSGNFNDTWAYDYASNAWTYRSLPNPPPARIDHALAYDTVAGKVILFGGYNGSYLNDTWAYDYASNSWTYRTPSNPPFARYGHALAYDASAGNVILFGGAGKYTGFLNDTCAYDYATNSWTYRSPANPPSARYGNALAYDPSAGNVILFGGLGVDFPLNDTWAYDYATNAWTDRNPANPPPARYQHALAYDASAGNVILFGGWDGNNSLNDTWAFRVNEEVSLSYNLTEGWNMISLPLTPASTDPNVVFGALPSPWYLFQWDPLAGIYVGKELIVLRLGAGYWLKVPTAVNYPVSGLPNGEAQSGIDLGLNWNLIGVPYEGTIPCGAVRISRYGGALVTLDQAVSSNWIQGMFFHWNGSMYDVFTTGGSFQSLFGYWLKAKVTGLQLVFLKP